MHARHRAGAGRTLTDLKDRDVSSQLAALQRAVREERRLQHQLVEGLLLDERGLSHIQAGLVGRGLCRGQEVEVVVGAAAIGGEGEVKEEPVRQRGDVVQVREAAAHAGGVDTAQGLGLILGTAALLLALLVLLHLGVEAVPLLLGHAAELHR